MALVLITGASAGLGRASVTGLVDQGHDVVLHARSAERIGDDTILSRAHDVLYGDLSSLSATVQVAERANEIGVFDAVIHNAGVLRGPEVLAVNTIAPFVLTALMAPRRSVYLSSSMHFSGSTDLGAADVFDVRGQGVPTRTASSTSPLSPWRSPRDARTCCPTPSTLDGSLPAWEESALPTASLRATSPRTWLATADETEIAPSHGGLLVPPGDAESAPRLERRRTFRRDLVRALETSTGSRTAVDRALATHCQLALSCSKMSDVYQ